jgi:hypothetical protein
MTARLSARRRRVVAAAALVLGAAPARAASLFPAGSESKAHGMESTLAARRGSAVLYNPSNLSLTPDRQPEVELGFANVQYSYEHPQYDPVVVTVGSPTVTLGYSGAISSRLTLGAVVFPEKMGKQEIPGVPRKLGNDTLPVAVDSDETAVAAGVGAAFALGDQASVGVAVVDEYKKRVLHAELVGGEGNLVDADVHGNFVRPSVGAQAHGDLLAGALRVTPARENHYAGRWLNGATDTTRPVDYDPLEVGLGARVGDRLAAGVDANFQQWSKGRDVVKTGFGLPADEADLHDVWERGFFVEGQIDPRLSVSASYAVLPTAWGAGHDDGTVNERVYGTDFGYLDGIDRKAYGLGAAVRLAPGVGLDFSLYHARGERVVSTGGDNVGFYQIATTIVSGTLAASF